MKVRPSESEFRSALQSALEAATGTILITTMTGEEIRVFEPIEIGKDYLIFKTGEQPTARRRLVAFFAIDSVVVD